MGESNVYKSSSATFQDDERDAQGIGGKIEQRLDMRIL